MDRWTRAAGLTAAVVVAGAGLGSCNILGPAAYLAMGQAKMPPMYVLEDRPTAIFVDDRNNAIPINSSRTRRTIADTISQELMGLQLVTKVIRPADAMALVRSQDREGQLLSMQAIGEAVGAEQLIYVEILSFRGSPDNVTPQPSAACRVKVIDVVNHTRLFPAPDAERGWQDVAVKSPAVSPELYQSTQGRRQIEQMLATLLGDQVTKLFYEHIPDEIGTRLETR